MGNLYAESGLNPTNLQNSYQKKLNYTDDTYTSAVDTGSYTNFVQDKAGYGLAQWTYWSRKKNLLNYAKQKNTSIGNLQMQLEFLFIELNTHYKKLLKILKNTNSIKEASNEVLFQFEQPANQSLTVQNQRESYSKNYYDKFTKIILNNGGTTNMKYSKSNPPLVCMMTHSTCYQQTSTMQVKGVLWHSTGANNPTLKRYVQPYEDEPNYEEMIALLGYNKNKNDWNHVSVQAGLNCWIGKLADGTVTTIQTMPWNYRPWGCGSGKNGSCNNGWIQFEICEDGLTDVNYFNKVYQEACEITAYLCEMYNINPYGTVDYNGLEVPTILCHRDSYDLGLGSGHADILHWFPKFGKDMDDIRKDVAELMNKITPAPTPVKPELYRVRKSWTDSKSQIGAYSNLDNAIIACDKAGPEYHVFNIAGEDIYPEDIIETVVPKVGDIVRVKKGAKWVGGAAVPNWVINSKMYLREIRKNGDYVISTVPTGPVTGVINPQYIYVDEIFQQYKVSINTAALNVRAAAGTHGARLGTTRQGTIHTILEENNGWGKIKFGNKFGWISLLYTKKV